MNRIAAAFAWWLRVTLPAHLSFATRQDRDRKRKAHLLSIAVLAAFALGLPLLITNVLLNDWLMVLVLIIFELVHISAGILNRLGRVTLGSSVYIVGYLSVCTLSLSIPQALNGVTPLWGWIEFVLPCIFAGLFLPAWAPMLFAATDSLLITAILLLEPANLAVFNTLPNLERIPFLVYIYVMMLAVGIICTTHAYTLERTAIEADRAAELELTNRALEDAHADLAAAYARVEEMATHDPITGLLNHRSLTEQLLMISDRALNTHETLAVVFTDLDHFKHVNDTWGHTIGDEVLRHLAELLRRNVRQQDLVARYGGEEFVLVLYDHDHDRARQTAERICTQVAANPYILPDGSLIPLTVSIGVAIIPDDVHSWERALIIADSAMYTAKHNGRNQVRMANELDEVA